MPNDASSILLMIAVTERHFARMDSVGSNPRRVPGRPFKPGQSGNPSRRPKGSRNRLSEDFLHDLHSYWQEHGSAVIDRLRNEKPDIFLRVVADVLPRHVRDGIARMAGRLGTR
jgi:hypothetical protein